MIIARSALTGTTQDIAPCMAPGLIAEDTRPSNSVTEAALPRERSLFAGRIAAMVLAVAAITLATRAHAAAEPNTRLVKCEGKSCLLITGERDSPRSAVQINDHPINVQGGRHWRAELPLSRVRELSAPFARSIEVTVYNAESGGATTRDADLPIGLMGHTDLASLIVRAR